MPKKHRNHNGDLCCTFTWNQGGGNHVYAHSKKGAIRRAKLFGMATHDRNGKKYPEAPCNDVVALIPRESSFSSVYINELIEFDRGLYLAYSL